MIQYGQVRPGTILNSLVPGRPGYDFKRTFSNLTLLIGIFTFSNDNVLRWMPPDIIDDQSALIYAMLATSHYLNQYWPSSMNKEN